MLHASTLMVASSEVLPNTRLPPRMVQLNFMHADALGVDGEDRPPTSNDGHDEHPAQPTCDGSSAMVHGMDAPSTFAAALASAQPISFIASLKVPLEVPLIQSPPRLRVLDLLPSLSSATRTRKSRPSGSCLANGYHWRALHHWRGIVPSAAVVFQA